MGFKPLLSPSSASASFLPPRALRPISARASTFEPLLSGLLSSPSSALVTNTFCTSLRSRPPRAPRAMLIRPLPILKALKALATSPIAPTARVVPLITLGNSPASPAMLLPIVVRPSAAMSVSGRRASPMRVIEASMLAAAEPHLAAEVARAEAASASILAWPSVSLMSDMSCLILLPYLICASRPALALLSLTMVDSPAASISDSMACCSSTLPSFEA